MHTEDGSRRFLAMCRGRCGNGKGDRLPPGAAGLRHPSQLRPIHIQRRLSAHEAKSFAECYPFLGSGELPQANAAPDYARLWAMSDAGSFDAVGPERAAAASHVVPGDGRETAAAAG